MNIEIYEAIESHGNTYVDLITEFQRIWSDYKISEPSENTANQGTYKKIVRNISSDIFANKPLGFNTTDQIKFTKNILRISGNLDARAIRDLLNDHKITRDYTVSDLEDFKDEVLNFIKAVLYTMKEYYDNKRYLIATISAVSQ